MTDTLETVFDGLIRLLRALGVDAPPTAAEERDASLSAQEQRAALLGLWQAALGEWEPLAIEGAALAWLAAHDGSFLRFPLPGALTRTTVDERIAVLQARGRLPRLPRSEAILTPSDPWPLHAAYSRWRLEAEEALQAFRLLPAAPAELAARLPPELLLHCQEPAPELLLAPPPELEEAVEEPAPEPPPAPLPPLPDGERVAWRPEGSTLPRRAVLLREEGEEVVVFDVIRREEVRLPLHRMQRLQEARADASAAPAAPAEETPGNRRVLWCADDGMEYRAVLLREEGEEAVIFDVSAKRERRVPLQQVQRLVGEAAPAPRRGGLGSPQALLGHVERQVLRFPGG